MKLTLPRLIGSCLLLLASLAPAQTVTVSGSHLGGQTPVTGVITFQPALNDGTQASVRVSGGGISSKRSVSAPVSAGSFSTSLLDTNVSTPQNLCYSVTVRDSTGAQILGPGFSCVQPAANNAWCTNSVCNFDLYTPSLPALPVQYQQVSGVSGVTPASIAAALGGAPVLTTGGAVSGPLDLQKATLNGAAPLGSVTAFQTYTSFGDSITCGFVNAGHTTPFQIGEDCPTANAYPSIIANRIGATLHNYAIPADMSCDVWPRQIGPQNVTPSLASPQLFSLMIGTNDANGKGIGAPEDNFRRCYGAVLSYLGIPAESKTMAGAVTPASGWGSSSNELGALLYTTTVGSVQAFPITTFGGGIFLWHAINDSTSYSGNLSYALDNSAGPFTTISTTTSVPMATVNGTSNSVGYVYIPGVAAGAHTVYVKLASGTALAVLGVGTPPQNQYYQHPVVVVGDPPLVPGVSATNVAVYAADALTAIRAMQASGLDIRYADNHAYMLGAAAEVQSDNVHPTPLGALHYAQAFLQIMQPVPASAAITAGSLSNVYVSQIGCPQGADLDSGMLAGTSTPAPDAGPCISSYLNSHVKPGGPFLLLHQDGRSVVSGIYGPAKGGWGISGDTKPGFYYVNITGASVSSNVFAASTDGPPPPVGSWVILNAFPTSTFLNRQPVLVTTSNAGTNYFQATFMPGFTHANASVEAGIFQVLTGNGFYQQSGTNNDVIHNGIASANCVQGYSDPGWITPGAAPQRGSGLILRQLAINGNKGDGTTGNSTTGNTQGAGTYQTSYGPAYCSYMGFNVMNMQNVELTDNYMFNYSAYGMRVMNVGQVQVLRNVFDPMGLGVIPYAGNNDGFHVSGPSEDGYLDGNLIRSGDDAFCLCADEGWVAPITRWTIANTHYDGALSSGRLITHSIAPPSGDALPTVSHIRVTGGVGNVGGSLFNVGDEGANTQTVQHMMWDIHFDHNTIENRSAPGRDRSGVKLADNMDDVYFEHETYSGMNNNPAYSVFTTYNNSTINSLTVNDVTLVRTASGSNTNALLNIAGATIGRLNLLNNRVLDADGGSYGQIPYLASINSTSSVASLFACGNDLTNVGVLAADVTRVTTLTQCGGGGGGGTAAPTAFDNAMATANVVIGNGGNNGNGLGSGGSLNNVTGVVRSHDILVTTGSAPAAGSPVMTITYPAALPRNSYCTVGPTSNPSSALYGNQQVVIVPSTTGYILYSGSTALPANTQFSWGFSCP